MTETDALLLTAVGLSVLAAAVKITLILSGV